MQITILISTFILKTSLVDVVLLTLLVLFCRQKSLLLLSFTSEKKLTTKLKTQLRLTTYKEERCYFCQYVCNCICEIRH